MAECFDEDDFWLPPQFLADDDNMLDKNTCATNKNNHQNCLTSSPFHSEPACFPFEFGNFGVFSDFSSPLESLKGSSETERDEEDCGPGLTLRMARSTIDDERVLSESPQSTLCDMESGSGGSQVSSCGSPERNCKVQSPPATWDLLHAVAEEVARMRMNESHVVLPQNGATSQVSVPVKNSTTGTGFYQKLDGPQFQHLQQKQNHPMVENGVRGWKGLSPSAWLPPRRGSGRRTLFPGTQGGIRESAGTGVFLPRHTNTQADERRKPVYSTVLVPARVVKALNLNLDEICSQPHLKPVAGGRFNSGNDVVLRLQINRGGNYQKRNIRREIPTDQEIKLPQEWTY